MSGDTTAANVLVVDDVPANLLALEAALEPLGQRVVRATSGEEALRRLLDEEFALVLLDARMPHLNGFETAALIRGRRKTRHLPIVFLTAEDDGGEEAGRAYAQGAVDFIRKPFDAEVLRAKVGVFVELYLRGEQIKRNEQDLRERDRRELEALNDQRYRTLADSIPECLWTTDGAGRVTYCNRVWQHYTGLSFGETAIKGLRAAVHEEDRERFDRAWREALGSGAPLDLELRFVRADGTARWHLARAASMTSASGALEWFGTSTDIDDRKRAEDRLRFLAEAGQALSTSLDYETTLANVAKVAVPTLCEGCLVHLLDPGGAIRLHAVALVDQSKEQLVWELNATSPARVEDAAGAPNVIRSGVTELARRSLPSVPPLSGSGDGARQSTSVALGLHARACLPLRARGEVFGAMTLLSTDPARAFEPSDLTFLEELALRASTAIENARLLRQRDDFLAIASHELKTPLTSMSLHLQRLLRPQPQSLDRIQRDAGLAKRALDRLLHLVDGLLDASRVASGRLELSTTVVDLSALVEACVARTEADILRLGGTLTRRIEPRVHAALDAGRIEEVVQALLSNAARHANAAAIELELTTRERTARLVVRDGGPGVPRTEAKKIFERFERGGGAGHHGGFGLGLWIARQIVSAHGGTISLERAADEAGGGSQGASFVVELPCECSSPEA